MTLVKDSAGWITIRPCRAKRSITIRRRAKSFQVNAQKPISMPTKTAIQALTNRLRSSRKWSSQDITAPSSGFGVGGVSVNVVAIRRVRARSRTTQPTPLGVDGQAGYRSRGCGQAERCADREHGASKERHDLEQSISGSPADDRSRIWLQRSSYRQSCPRRSPKSRARQYLRLSAHLWSPSPPRSRRLSPAAKPATV